MKLFSKTILPILLATIWISLSEFLRNEILLKSQWVSHYENLGMTFPSQGINGAVWGIWSLLFAISIYIMSKRFNLTETTLFSWFMAFAMMWIVIGNLNVLPFGILYFAIPLSLLESFIASYIIHRMK